LNALSPAADRFGLALVEALYGHVGGADRFFARLPDAKARLGDRAAAWFATHPVSEKRIDALHSHARKRGWSEQGSLQPLPSVR
jgi:predicted Zn-dependent protease